MPERKRRISAAGGGLNGGFVIDFASMVLFGDFLDNVIGLWAVIFAVVTIVLVSARRVADEVHLTL